MERRVYFVTANEGKLREARAVLGKYGFRVEAVNARKLELQSESLEEVVSFAAAQLVGKVAEPFIVEDAGLFIQSLGGFPGPYSSYVYKTLGVKGVLKLLEDVQDRRAKFVSVSALCFRGETRTFKGEIEGTISFEAKGSAGFGFDPIFIPVGYDLTFAQMSLQLKCEISHRARSLSALANYLLQVRDFSSNFKPDYA